MPGLDRDSIAAAHARIAAYVRATPVLEADGGDFGFPGLRLVFKLEFLQHAGSFKTRGAFNQLLTRDIGSAGVVAASGGNHGVAVSYAAMKLGIPATIFVPTVASAAKIEQIREHGAKLVVGGDRYDDALRASEAFVASSGATRIHAFDQWETLQGQGTVGLEWERQSPGLDAILVAVGGGGLIGGMAGWFAGRMPIIGVEPEEAPTLTRALEAGEPVDAPAGGLAADSLAPRRVGSLMFGFAQRYLRTVLVTDDAIRDSQRALWKSLRIVAEPGGAAAFAGLASGAWKPAPGQKTIGVLVCGANTTAVTFT
ncbi:MAG TPA: threonine/serine dehydratase [Usitatibacter sp.]|jgi:threonine dehydratase|nr:threonine/serine dehydratase [Usitatibacter sp.]